jgi:hypothetical protein
MANTFTHYLDDKGNRVQLNRAERSAWAAREKAILDMIRSWVADTTKGRTTSPDVRTQRKSSI